MADGESENRVCFSDATVWAISSDWSVRFWPIIPFRKRLDVLYKDHSFAVTACGKGRFDRLDRVFWRLLICGISRSY